MRQMALELHFSYCTITECVQCERTVSTLVTFGGRWYKYQPSVKPSALVCSIMQQRQATKPRQATALGRFVRQKVWNHCYQWQIDHLAHNGGVVISERRDNLHISWGCRKAARWNAGGHTVAFPIEGFCRSLADRQKSIIAPPLIRLQFDDFSLILASCAPRRPLLLLNLVALVMK